MTKKLLFSLLLACCMLVAGKAQAQEVIEQAAQALGTTSVTKVENAQSSASAMPSAQDVSNLQAKFKAALEPARKAVPDAECKQVSATAEPSLQLLEGTYGEGSWTATAAKPQRAPKFRANTLPEQFYAAEFDYAYKDGSENIAGLVKVKLTSETTAVIYGLWGLTDTLQATFDATAGTVSITPCQVYKHSTYGPIWACSFNGSSYSTTTPITGTIAADGTITLGGWGVFVYSGTYKGGYFGLYSKSVFKLTNATVTDVIYDGTSVETSDSTVTYPVYIDQPYDNQARIINFSNYGKTVNMRLKTDSTVYIAPQRMFSNLLYGYFSCYPAAWATSKSAQKGNINGTTTPTEIDLGNWGVFCEASQSLRSRGVVSSKIVFAEGTLSYPKPTEQDWTGAGTEASPYVITTPTQLVAFGEQVNGGDDFSGKYVTLGNDIDLSTLTLAYTSIGSADCPFRGNFNGKGYSIKNLSFEVGAEDYQGLFGYADSASVITNFTLDAATVTTGGRYSGGVAGWSSGVMTDVKVTNGTFTFTNYAGAAVVGYFNGSSLKNIYAKATVSGAGENGLIVGQLVGQAKASNLEAHGSLKATYVANTLYCSFGGVFGGTLPSPGHEPEISDCYSDVQVVTSSLNSPYTGGVGGQMLTGTLQRAFNAGPVQAKSNYTSSSDSNAGAVGGIVGEMLGATIRDCYNSNYVANTTQTLRIGGIVGFIVSPMITINVSTGDTTKITYPSAAYNCLSTGQTYQATMLETQGAYGVIYSDSIMHNCYFDQQMVGNTMPQETAQMAKTTAELTSGEALSGFDTSVWNFTQGLYPRLKGIDTNYAAYLGAAPLTMKEGDNVLKVKNTMKIATSNDIYWKLYSGSSFVDSSTGLNIQGDSVTLNNCYSSEILVALNKNDGSLLKMFVLKTINPAAFEGSGTESDPFLIKTKADLISLNDGVTNYSQTFRGDYFKQCNDIDIEGATDFKGIAIGGNAAIFFDGTYDGQGYYLHNFKVDGLGTDDNGKAVAKNSTNYIAPFGILGVNGTVKNLNLASDCEIRTYTSAAGIVAVNYGKVTNCKNYGKITAMTYAAGIVSFNYDTPSCVESCYNAGTVTAGHMYSGGIVAYNYGTVKYCQNDGTVLGDSINSAYGRNKQFYVAGIVAYNTAKGSVVTGNVNTGAISAAKQVAGVTACLSIYGTTVTGNVNYGMVTITTTESTVGGVIGMTSGLTLSDIASNYYDSQIICCGAVASNVQSGVTEGTTTDLTSGKALEGVDANYFDFTAGLYPVIKAFKDEPAAVAHRKMIVTFAKGQTADDMSSSATLNSASDLTWAVTDGTNFTIADGAVTPHIGNELTSLRDTLVAKVGEYDKVIPLRAMPKLFDGAGTADDPFQIKTKDDMLKLAKFTNDELYPFKRRYFKVLNDIDFGTTTYEVVGKGSGSFEGYFDGNGKKFYNINNVLAKTTESYNGLFGTLGPNGTIHDLNLVSGTISAYRGAAGIAAYVYGQVYDCEVHANVTTTKSTNVGGIAAVVKDGGVVKRCKNYANLTAASGNMGGIAYSVEAGGRIESCSNDTAITSVKTVTGGIAALNYGTIIDCQNNAKISATSTVGGIVAHSYGGDSIINCHNYGEIATTGSSVGGILGINNSSKSLEPTVISGCHNEADVTGKGYLGGIAGRLYAGYDISDSYNTGNVISTSSTNIGGFVGQASGAEGYTCHIYRCHNDGPVIGAGNYTAGFVGNTTSGSELDDCYNSADVLQTGNYGAGFGGSISGVARNCYNYGNVESTGIGIGGFAGLGAGEAHGCFNLGNVTSTKGNKNTGVAGGLWGYGRPKVYDCYNMGTVTGQAYVGGLAGGVFSSIVLKNCYNAGTVACADSVNRGSISPMAEDNSFGYVNVLYDTDVNPGVASATDEFLAKGVSTRTLTLTNLSDSSYNVLPGMYPTLKYQADNAIANWFAAVPVFAEGESAEHIKSFFVIGTPDSTEWTASDNLWINGNEVHGTAVGEAWITKTYGKFTKTYKLYVEVPSGVQDIDTNAQIVRTEYYTVSGMMLGTVRPTGTGVYVARDIYSNGAAQAHKLVVR